MHVDKQTYAWVYVHTAHLLAIYVPSRTLMESFTDHAHTNGTARRDLWNAHLCTNFSWFVIIRLVIIVLVLAIVISTPLIITTAIVIIIEDDGLE